MEKRATIKDIAAELNVSIGTVHRALHGKKGVSEATINQVLASAARWGYQANTAASALKRGPVRFVAAFPVPEGRSRYFYAGVWKGFRRCIAELRDYNVEVVELFYYGDDIHSQGAELTACFHRYEGKIDALITVGQFDAAARKAIETYREHNIPIFLACDDDPCGRIACVQADHDLTGRIAAELLASQTPAGGAVLLCAGDALIPSHCQTVSGFTAYVRESAPSLEVVPLYGYNNEDDLRRQLRSILSGRQNITSAFSVSARLSVLLAEEIEAAGKVEQIRIVASDLFEETIRNMERGVVRNILFKNPEQQSYLATKLLSDYVLKNLPPMGELHYVESHVIFKSNLRLYTG